ncbi:kinase-like protein [Heliocybe sulcata]|uniref:Kinase-like protein n=1 Tax=Heliocybe sulcata TaxID=5364 RepID=A0A5C3N828_9AGAM|nr:kinase-like protein [Heliocybe sulcata]
MLPPALFKDTDEIQVDLTERCDSGGYGTVWMAKIEGRAVAIKILNTVLSDDHEHRFSREVIIWRQLHHRNILPLLGLCRACPPPAQPGPGMISPWCKNGNLNSYLRKQLRRNRSLERIADALSYMHRHDAVHKDLKLLNIVVDDNLEPCLTDFGITTFASSRTVSREPGSSGSCRWMAPEVFRRPGETDADVRNRVTAACDMYGFACVCLEMYTLKYPWHDIRSEEEVEINVLAGERPPRPDGIPDEVWSIMESCWVQDRQDRMKSEDAHKAFAAMLA